MAHTLEMTMPGGTAAAGDLAEAPPREADLLAAHAEVRERLFRAVLRIVQDADEAADVVQETLVRARRALPRYRGDASLATWLTRIATNLALKAVRRRRTRERLRHLLPGARRESPATPEALLRGSEQAARLEAAIAALPDRQRAAFVLRHVEELPVAEVAQALGISVATTKTHLLRALKRLRADLADVR